MNENAPVFVERPRCSENGAGANEIRGIICEAADYNFHNPRSNVLDTVRYTHQAHERYWL